ncbi:hypothetical protein HYY74_00945 [Candidatus Woesearchaeota archaeon]|nr:hypothetical protein [Candidatus Woesearchaeota archaeon]
MHRKGISRRLLLGTLVSWASMAIYCGSPRNVQLAPEISSGQPTFEKVAAGESSALHYRDSVLNGRPKIVQARSSGELSGILMLPYERELALSALEATAEEDGSVERMRALEYWGRTFKQNGTAYMAIPLIPGYLRNGKMLSTFGEGRPAAIAVFPRAFGKASIATENDFFLALEEHELRHAQDYKNGIPYGEGVFTGKDLKNVADMYMLLEITEARAYQQLIKAMREGNATDLMMEYVLRQYAGKQNLLKKLGESQANLGEPMKRLAKSQLEAL